MCNCPSGGKSALRDRPSGSICIFTAFRVWFFRLLNLNSPLLAARDEFKFQIKILIFKSWNTILLAQALRYVNVISCLGNATVTLCSGSFRERDVRGV